MSIDPVFRDGAVTLRVDGPVAFVTFDRPWANNAMTWSMYDALFEACERLDDDPDVMVIVFRGAGGRAFTAGTDIRQFVEFASGADGLDYEARIERVVGRLERVGAPTVAVIDGYAVGGGMTISAVCDFRLCTTQSTFGIPIARTIGNCLSMRNYARLVSLVGPSRTKELIFMSELLSAEEAYNIGLVSKVVEPDAIDEVVSEFCNVLIAHAPVTMRVTKEAVRRLTMRELQDGDDLVRQCYGSKDFQEGVSAFLGKRTPEWKGY